MTATLSKFARGSSRQARSTTWGKPRIPGTTAVAPDPAFESLRRAAVAGLRKDTQLHCTALEFYVAASRHRYSYQFDWLGLPIIQFPTDIVAVQELLWRVRPRAIVETGVARGGSLALSASMLQLLGDDGLVIGVDIDIRQPNRVAIEAHPLAHRIRLVQGSSTAADVLQEVNQLIDGRQPVLVLLDSLHTHEHVLAELQLYGPLVRAGSYIVVFDTVVADMPADFFPDRPWSTTNNPKTAVTAFLEENPRFVVDDDIEARLQITSAPSGYLCALRDP